MANVKTTDSPASNTDDTVAIARKAPVIDPGSITMQSEGFHYREWFVRLPQGFRVDDIP